MNDMQDSLRELYQEVIFDHNRNPRNYRPLPAASHHADGHNPLCGDQLPVYVQVEDGIVREASFVGHGCAISTASASLMTEAVKGKPVEEVEDPMASLAPFSTFAKGWRRYGDGRARVENVMILNSDAVNAETLLLREDFVIRLVIAAVEDVVRPAIGFSFRDLKGNQIISSMTSNYRHCAVPDFQAGERYVVDITGENLLTQGVYTLTLGIESIVDNNRAHEYVDVVENVVTFQSSFGSDAHDIFPGMVWQPMRFSVASAGSGRVDAPATPAASARGE